MLWNKKYKALLFGIVIAPIIYFIDAQIWWNTLTDGNIFIREYWIGGAQIPHNASEYLWLKFGADFMMTISYALYTFPWIWIMFENIRRFDWRETAKYTGLFLFFWFAVPALSFFTSLDDTIVETVRHMDSQILFWVINVIVGYGLLLVVYYKKPSLVLKVFLVGFIGALIMELPLYIFGIRKTGVIFVLFEAIFLLNQGVLYLFLLWDKVLCKKKTTSNIL